MKAKALRVQWICIQDHNMQSEAAPRSMTFFQKLDRILDPTDPSEALSVYSNRTREWLSHTPDGGIGEGVPWPPVPVSAHPPAPRLELGAAYGGVGMGTLLSPPCQAELYTPPTKPHTPCTRFPPPPPLPTHRKWDAV